MAHLASSSRTNMFDGDYIYDYLNTLINGAKCYHDLHHLIHDLLPIDELKAILSRQVAKLRTTDKSSNADSSLLQRLYIKSASIEEIFSDDILVNIVRFLPSNQYPKISCISRNFQNLMKQYPSIYTQYTVNIVLEPLLLTNKEGVLWIVVHHAAQMIYVVHRIKNDKSTAVRNDSLSIRRQLEEDKLFNDPKAIKFEIKHIDDINHKIPFLWYCCKKWNIQSTQQIVRKQYLSASLTSSAYASSVLSYKSMRSNKFNISNASDSLSQNIAGITKDFIKLQHDKNNLFISILNKSCNYIESLCVDNINDKDGAKWLMLNDLGLYKLLNHLCINQVIHNLILESWLNTPHHLKYIQYLQLNIQRPQAHLNLFKQLIEMCSNLMVFDCYITSANVTKTSPSEPREGRLSILFPKRVQFVRMQFVSEYFRIDLSQCENLCALYLNDTLHEAPHDSTHLPLGTIQSGDIEVPDTDGDDTNDEVCNTMTQGKTHKVFENIIWPKNGGIECMLLEQAMDDVHNMSTAFPWYINAWYNAFKSNTLIPVRYVRYITHPFIEMNDEAQDEDEKEEDDDNASPGPPQFGISVPIRPSANMHFTSIKYDDYADPLKLERDKIDFINLKQLKNVKNNSNNYRKEIIQVLDDEEDEDDAYIGYLWKLLLILKYKKDSHGLEEQLKIYHSWFDKGLAKWIEELGADFVKGDFYTAPMNSLHPYSHSYRGGILPGGWH